MKTTRLGAILFALTMLLSISSPVSAVVVDRIIAIVNDTIITQSDLNNAFEPVRKKIEENATGAEREKLLKNTREAYLNRMIDSILIEHQAAKLGISVSDEDVTATIRNILAQKNLTMDDFEKILEKEGLTLESYKKDVKEQMTRTKVIRRELRPFISVSDEEIGEYYIQHRTEYEGQTAVRIKQIVMFFPEDADEALKRKVRGEMENLLQRLQSGEPFDKLAVQYSQGPTARDGGDIGYVERGVMSPELEQVVFSMEPGQVSGIIESSTGLSIVAVTAKRGGSSKGIESVRDEIKDKIMDAKMEKKYDEWISDLRNKAHIILKN